MAVTRGWAWDRDELAACRAAADQLVGRRIGQVRYVNIDSRGWELGHRDQGVRRLICAEAEWADPTWDAGDFHHLDYGVELLADDGRLWTVTWDMPGPGGESLVLREGSADECGAVWDVTDRHPWSDCIASPLSEVSLRYHPWSERGGFWCTRATLRFGDVAVELLLGDRDVGRGDLVPAATAIAVVFDGRALPDWERTDDLL